MADQNNSASAANLTSPADPGGKQVLRGLFHYFVRFFLQAAIIPRVIYTPG